LSDLLKDLADQILIVIRNEEDVVLCSRTILEENICPVFLVSNSTGTGLEHFLSFLNLLPIKNANWKKN
jgi:GTPase